MYEITKQLNLSWFTHVPPEKNKWGRLVNKSFDGGVLKLVHQGAADVAYCGLWVDPSILDTGIEMSVPIGHECMKFLVPRPKPENTGWLNILKPFDTYLWICIFLFFIFSTCLLRFFSWTSYHWHKPHASKLLYLF